MGAQVPKVQHSGGLEGEAKHISTGHWGSGQICFEKHHPPQPKKAAGGEGPGGTGGYRRRQT